MIADAALLAEITAIHAEDNAPDNLFTRDDLPGMAIRMNDHRATLLSTVEALEEKLAFANTVNKSLQDCLEGEIKSKATIASQAALIERLKADNAALVQEASGERSPEISAAICKAMARYYTRLAEVQTANEGRASDRGLESKP